MPARSIALTDKVKWKFSGNMNSSALAVGDVDNDGDNEFVVGNIHGTLGIFKYISSKEPWKVVHHLGTITCLAIGDVRNHGKNSIVCINAEGKAHIFDLSSNIADDVDNSQPDTTTEILSSVSISVPVNICRILIADIDADGKQELILGRTDRYLHSYSIISEYTPRGSVVRIHNQGNQGARTDDSLLLDSIYVKSPFPDGGLDSQKPRAFPSQPSKIANISNVTDTDSYLRVDKRVRLKEKKTWYFDGQIGTLAVSKDASKKTTLLVSQPGGCYVPIDSEGVKHPLVQPMRLAGDQLKAPENPQKNQMDNYFLKSLNETMTFHQVRYNTAPNNSVPSDNGGLFVDFTGKYGLEVGTEIVAGIKREGKVRRDSTYSNDLIALVTMDGTITVTDPQLWIPKSSDLQVNHQLFSASKLNLINPESLEMQKEKYKNDPEWKYEESEQIVACSWDSTTYIVDSQLNAVQIVGGERVCAFVAAMYSIEPGKTVPCFFYINFEDDITVYYNVMLNSIPIMTLVDVTTGQPYNGQVSSVSTQTSVHLSSEKSFFDKFDKVLHKELPDYADWLHEKEQEVFLTRFSSTSTGSVDWLPKSLPDLFRKCIYDREYYESLKEEESSLILKERDLQKEMEELTESLKKYQNVLAEEDYNDHEY